MSIRSIFVLRHKILVAGFQPFKHRDELVFRRKDGYPAKKHLSVTDLVEPGCSPGF